MASTIEGGSFPVNVGGYSNLSEKQQSSKRKDGLQILSLLEKQLELGEEPTIPSIITSAIDNNLLTLEQGKYLRLVLNDGKVNIEDYVFEKTAAKQLPGWFTTKLDSFGANMGEYDQLVQSLSELNEWVKQPEQQKVIRSNQQLAKKAIQKKRSRLNTKIQSLQNNQKTPEEREKEENRRNLREKGFTRTEIKKMEKQGFSVKSNGSQRGMAAWGFVGLFEDKIIRFKTNFAVVYRLNTLLGKNTLDNLETQELLSSFRKHRGYFDNEDQLAGRIKKKLGLKSI